MVQATEAEVIEREVFIRAKPETIYQYFVDPERFVRWMAHDATLEPQPGGLIRLNYNGTDIMRGEFRELVPHSKVVFTWGWEAEGAAIPPGASTVEVTLVPEADGTRLRLVHSGLTADAGSHAEGWDHFLPRLAKVAAGEDPGRDEWAPREAEFFAAELARVLKEARGLIASAPPQAWSSSTPAEGWSAGALAAHLVSHANLVGFAVDLSEGKESPFTAFTIEMLEQNNAKGAQENASITPEEVLARLDAASSEVERLRAITDEGLARGAAMAFAGGAHLTTRDIIEGPLLGNMREHLASLRQTLG